MFPRKRGVMNLIKSNLVTSTGKSSKFLRLDILLIINNHKQDSLHASSKAPL